MSTIYLTNAASVAAVARGNAKPETAACVGPGPVLSIMRFPREEMGEAGVGRVLALTPPQRLAAPAIVAKKASDRRPHTAHCPVRLKHGDGECECGADELATAWRAYEAALYRLWEPYFVRLAPGVLGYGEARRGVRDGLDVVSWDGDFWARLGDVPDGATLICACSQEAAAAGRCHRVIAADLLKRAGWSVVLDGRRL
ncbi:MAG TPA: hypothetical protein PLU52_07275 [Opitutaceae bacterium]|nr:hypothetical protein [Opitutaceae bacterium]